MKNPRTAAAVIVAALIVVVTVAYWRQPDPAPADQPTGPLPVATIPGTTATPSQTPLPEPDPTTSPTSGQSEPPTPQVDPATGLELPDYDEGESFGLLSTLGPEARDAVYAAGIDAATQLTAQDPNEDRASRLAVLFPAGADTSVSGPAGARDVVTPVVVNWVQTFDTQDPAQVGLIVSIHYEIVRAVADATSWGEGDAEWRIRLGEDGAGRWRLVDVVLQASTDY